MEELAEKLTAAMPKLDATDQRIALGLVRQLALGAPVGDAQLAADVALAPARVAETLERLPGIYRDDHNRVIGFDGLTVIEMGHHRLHLDGRALSAWCALDTLFLPDLLGDTIRVTSRCPVTAEEISLTVSASGVRDLRPAGAVVSLLVPDRPFDTDVIKTFCRFVHFFSSEQAGRQWMLEHHGTFLASVEDSYRLGQLINRTAFGAALGSDHNGGVEH